jgi:pimeloyl-ACP methyl ester carboxylesterase
MMSDVEEMAAWTRREFGKDKIFVLGHSYGSFLGLQFAQRHPKWLYAYIGVAQSIDGPENERRGWRFAIDAARRAGNLDAVRELEAIAPYAAPGHAVPIKDLYVQRKWVGYYGGVVAYRTNNSADSDLAKLFPDLVAANLSQIRKLAVPLILFEGRHDRNVNSQVAAAWFDTVNAPEKHLVWFEHSGHMPMTEEPAKFFLSLIRYVRPIAERANDSPPLS